MPRGITDRVYGCLIGGAIGDALGAPVEGWTHERIDDEYGQLEEFKQYYMPHSNSQPGAVTSDTTLRHYLSLSVVNAGGRVTPEEFADVLREHLNPDRTWINDEITLKKLSAGVNPWDAGVGAIPDNKAASAITPIGLVNAGDPTQAYQDGYNVGSVLQEGHHRHATATVAAGIAAATVPDATVASVIEAMVEHATGVVGRAIDLALGFAEQSDTVEELVALLYDRFLDWRWPPVQWDRDRYFEGEVLSASTLESLPVSVAILRACDGAPNRSIVESVNYGRDSDAIATVAGSIAGTLHGATALRGEWIEQCEAANREFFAELEGDPDADFRSMAERLVGALENERDRAEARTETLERVLGESEP